MSNGIKETDNTRKRYNRISPLYDLMERLMERSRFSKWREFLWNKVEGGRILEVGVGTGKNFPYYPAAMEITAVDLSDKMLGRAQKKASQKGPPVLTPEDQAQNRRRKKERFIYH